MAKLGLAFHEDFIRHDAGPDHPERAERALRILDQIKQAPWAGEVEFIEPRLATQDEVALVHDKRYVEAMRRLCDAGGQYLPMMDAAVGSESYPAALRAVGAGLTLADGVMSGRWPMGFGLVRPPGHHAVYARPWGCCIFNNVAILAKYLLTRYNLSRIGILDFDVHHGNGTEQAFWTEPRVLFCSVHQENYFPSDTGDWYDVGEGEGKDFTINIPLPPKTQDKGYIEIVDKLVSPRFREFKPEIMLASAGFDGHWRDLQGGLNLTGKVFGEIAKRLRQWADIAGQGRIIAMLEGGYDFTGNAECVAKFFGELVS